MIDDLDPFSAVSLGTSPVVCKSDAIAIIAAIGIGECVVKGKYSGAD
jgi:hypothetical protein